MDLNSSKRFIYIGLVVAAIAAAIAFAVVKPNGATPQKENSPIRKREIIILAISDIHNNVAAMKNAGELARKYSVDVIVDAGDLTDFGSRSETDIIDEAGRLPVPHVFIAGNHDSTFTIESLRRFKNTVLPDEQTANVAGLSVLGQDDPASRAEPPHSVDTTTAQLEQSYRRLSKIIKSLPKHPDVLIVHNPKIGERFAGKAAIIVTGHGHRAYARKESGSVIVNPGSTGAAGIRYFIGSHTSKTAAAVIYATPGQKVTAKRVDLITMDGDKSPVARVIRF